MSKVSYKAISAADFFYRNRDIAGFDNPTRAIYTAVRELVENSLDACEDGGILPEIKVIMKNEGDNVYQITVEDNGIGVPETTFKAASAEFCTAPSTPTARRGADSDWGERWPSFTARSQPTNPST